MDISVAHESPKEISKKKSRYLYRYYCTYSIAVGIFVPFSSKSDSINGLIVGGVLFIVVFIPYIYLYYPTYQTARLKYNNKKRTLVNKVLHT